ncbi:ABC transporter permease [Bacillus sp. FJAT-45037]|uniref:ABC transporter permease n=1 Tax=Bacillus sp. FJAT-45037 TaxID=2011007 RepID=UPI000C2472CB|nr:ABC transporter permease [Bacillus sp. FJAT-45037]
MGTFLKKDLLVLLRDRTELIVLLAMPLILLTILGFALRGLLGGDTEALNMTVALVSHDEEELGIEQFINELEDSTLPDEAVDGISEVAITQTPLHTLEQFLNDESIRNMVEVIEMSEEQADTELSTGEITAIFIVPEDFTYNTMQKMYLNSGEGSEFSMIVEEYSLQANIFRNIINSFISTFNFETAISLASQGGEGFEGSEEVSQEIGGVETLSANEPVTSFQYYTIGMAVMFVLYVSSTLASKAYVEKQQHVFDRIILSGTHPFFYLSGKFISATVIGLIQLFILFGLSQLIFEPFTSNSLSFWSGMLLISFALAICVGGLASLLTSISNRWDSDTFSNVFAGGVVSIFAFAGGSFFPTSDMPEIISMFGNWTPNGAALTAYLQWMQGFGMMEIFPLLVRVVVIGMMSILISVMIFPHRRSN